jgi:hypothetical protein
VTNATAAPLPYRVVYAEVARIALRAFGAAARAAGHTQDALATLKELDYRLRVYPQFGEPLTDLKQETGQIFIGTVAPLMVRYAVYELRRLVVVARVHVLKTSIP